MAIGKVEKRYHWLTTEANMPAPLEEKSSPWFANVSSLAKAASNMSFEEVASLSKILPACRDFGYALLDIVNELTESSDDIPAENRRTLGQIKIFLQSFLDKTGFLPQSGKDKLPLDEKLKRLQTAVEQLIHAIPLNSGKRKTIEGVFSIERDVFNVLLPLLRAYKKLIKTKNKLNGANLSDHSLKLVLSLIDYNEVFNIQNNIALLDLAPICKNGGIISFFGLYEKFFNYNNLLSSGMDMMIYSRKIMLFKNAFPEIMKVYGSGKQIYAHKDIIYGLLFSGEPWTAESLISWRLDLFRTLTQLFQDPQINSMLHNMIRHLSSELSRKMGNQAGSALATSIGLVMGPVVSILRWTKYLEPPAAMTKAVTGILHIITSTVDDSGKAKSMVQLLELLQGGLSLSSWLELLASSPAFLQVLGAEFSAIKVDKLLEDKTAFFELLHCVLLGLLFNPDELEQFPNHDPLQSQDAASLISLPDSEWAQDSKQGMFLKGLLTLYDNRDSAANVVINIKHWIGFKESEKELKANEKAQLDSDKARQKGLAEGYDLSLESFWNPVYFGKQSTSFYANLLEATLAQIGRVVKLPKLHLFKERNKSLFKSAISLSIDTIDWTRSLIRPNTALIPKEEKDWSDSKTNWERKLLDAQDKSKMAINAQALLLKEMAEIKLDSAAITVKDLDALYSTFYMKIAVLDKQIDEAQTAAVDSYHARLVFNNLRDGSLRQKLIVPLLKSLSQRVGKIMLNVLQTEIIDFLQDFDQQSMDFKIKGFPKEARFARLKANQFLLDMDPATNPSRQAIGSFKEACSEPLSIVQATLGMMEDHLNNELSTIISAAACKKFELKCQQLHDELDKAILGFKISLDAQDQEAIDDCLRRSSQLSQEISLCSLIVEADKAAIEALNQELNKAIAALNAEKNALRIRILEQAMANKLKKIGQDIQRLDAAELAYSHQEYRLLKSDILALKDEKGIQAFVGEQRLNEKIILPLVSYLGAPSYEFSQQREHFRAQLSILENRLIQSQLDKIFEEVLREICALIHAATENRPALFKELLSKLNREKANFVISSVFPSYNQHLDKSIFSLFRNSYMLETAAYTQEIEVFNKKIEGILKAFTPYQKLEITDSHIATAIEELKKLPEISNKLEQETNKPAMAKPMIDLESQAADINSPPSPCSPFEIKIEQVPLADAESKASEEKPADKVLSAQSSPEAKIEQAPLPEEELALNVLAEPKTSEKKPTDKAVSAQSSSEFKIEQASPPQEESAANALAELKVSEEKPADKAVSAPPLPEEALALNVLAEPKTSEKTPADKAVSAQSSPELKIEQAHPAEEKSNLPATSEINSALPPSAPVDELKPKPATPREQVAAKNNQVSLQQVQNQLIELQGKYASSNQKMNAAIKAVYDQGLAELEKLKKKDTVENKQKLFSLHESIKLAISLSVAIADLENNDSKHPKKLRETIANQTICTLNNHIKTQSIGRSSTCKKLLGALVLLAGAAIISLSILGIPFSGGSSLALMYAAGSLCALSSPLIFFSGTQGKFPKTLSKLEQTSSQVTGLIK